MTGTVDNSSGRRSGRTYPRHMEHNILTLEQAAQRLNLTVDEVYQLVRAGDLLGIKIPEQGWFVHGDQVDEYAAAHG